MELYARDSVKAPDKSWTALPRIDRDHMHLSVKERCPPRREGPPVNAEAAPEAQACGLLDGASGARVAEIMARLSRIFEKYPEGGERSDAV